MGGGHGGELDAGHRAGTGATAKHGDGLSLRLCIALGMWLIMVQSRGWS